MLINFTIFNKTNSNTLVPWRIHPVQPQVSFRGFYYSEASRLIAGGHCGFLCPTMKIVCGNCVYTRLPAMKSN